MTGLPAPRPDVQLGRVLSPPECRGACALGTCNAAGSFQGCGGCCGCLGGCFEQAQGREVRHQYRVADRRLVRLCLGLPVARPW